MAVILLIFSAFICTAEFIFVNSCADEITEKIESIQKAYREGNKEIAIKYALEAEEEWQDKVDLIDMLLYHDYVDEITGHIVNLKTYIAEDDSVGLYSTCNESLTRINSLKKSEFPTMDNII